MKFKNPLIYLGAFLFIFFIIFTFLVHLNFFHSLDLRVTIFFQNLIPGYFDLPFSLFSLMGSFEIAIVIILVLPYLNKKLNYYSVLLFFGLFHILEYLGKFFVTHPGPTSKFFRYDIPFLFPSSSVSTGSSYPSGHLGRTLFISVLLIFVILNSKRLTALQKKLLYCFIVGIVALMFVSRIYLGEHWFSDVIGGSILGGSLGLFSLAFL